MEHRGWSANYVRRINLFGWERFCHPRKEAIVSWVHEFYANLKFQKDNIVLVRGREVHFSAEAINDLFEILESSKFSREAKAWLLFVNASLMPTRHSNKISFERALLVFGILSDVPINVGRIVSQQMLKKASQDKIRPLWFPTLITELCRNAGVSAGEGDLITVVGHHITQTVIMTNIKESADGFKKGDHSTETADFAVSHQPSSSTAANPPITTNPEVPSLHQDKESNQGSNDYVKDYLRYQHVYLNSRLDYLTQNQAKLMKKAKIPIPAPVFQSQSRFDEEGFLLHRNGKRADPTSYEGSASDSEA
ncbi:hypothetical protein KSP39_PZI020837 [Platanthera zijinensis]|uniref:Putative plant transposon protein domain-containing protein n=1 Tax=Platanthera zijinensis TaxID=2320716 RepID=A0AAP0B0F2_9ASPA